jgi:hypothetical protein
MAQVLKEVKYPGQGRLTGISLTLKVMEETDRLRGDIPRSRWIERALTIYNACMKEGKEVNGVWGSQATNQTSTPATPPTPEPVVVVPQKINTLFNKWRSSG